MPSTDAPSPISDRLLSSVVPAKKTAEGEQKRLTSMDLALKLHYIRAVFYFQKEAVHGFTVSDLKLPIFQMLSRYTAASGRIRRCEDTGELFVKCNDSGVRVVEVFFDKTMEEWLGFNPDKKLLRREQDNRFPAGNHDCVTHDGIIGPEIDFSPLIYLQFTRFKCGGMAIGVTWSHILGDPISVFAFINVWIHLLDGRTPPEYRSPGKAPPPPFSSRNVPPLGKMVTTADNCWKQAAGCIMASRSFHFNPKELDTLFSDVISSSGEHRLSYFQAISAFLWKLVAKTSCDSNLNSAIICTVSSGNRTSEGAGNIMKWSKVDTIFPVEDIDLRDLAAKIGEKQGEDGLTFRDEAFCSESGNLHRVVYGSLLTFVDLEEEDFYEMELRGHKPLFVNYMIDGVDENGTVLLLRGPDGGRTINLIFPKERLEKIATLERPCL